MLFSRLSGESIVATSGSRFGAGELPAETDCPHSLGVILPKKKHKQIKKPQES